MTDPMSDKDAWGPRIRRKLGQVRRTAQDKRRPVGEKPEVVREETHYGSAVDDLVARQRENQRRYGVNDEYDLVRENFDHYHYALQTQGVLDEGADPIRHFLWSGPVAKFSPHPDFNARKYLRRHPERRTSTERSLYLEWLKRGREAGEIADPAEGVEPMAELLGMDPLTVVDKVRAIRSDATERLRTGTLGEMFAKAVELEPLIGDAWRETAARIAQLPLRNDSVAVCVAAIHDAHEQAGFRRARVVVAVDRPRADGLDVLVVTSLAAGVDPSEIVVIYTDAAPDDVAVTLPSGVRVVDFHSRFADLAWVMPEDRQQAMVSLVRSFWADALVNVESELFHDMLAPYAKALLSSERIFLSFGTGPDGRPSPGSLRWLYPTIGYVESILVADDAVRDSLDEHFQLTAPYLEKFHVLGADGDPDLATRVLREEARA